MSVQFTVEYFLRGIIRDLIYFSRLQAKKAAAINGQASASTSKPPSTPIKSSPPKTSVVKNESPIIPTAKSQPVTTSTTVKSEPVTTPIVAKSTPVNTPTAKSEPTTPTVVKKEPKNEPSPPKRKSKTADSDDDDDVPLVC